MIDVAPLHLEMVRGILRQHVPEREVRVFGSRVQGGAKAYSDLDIVVLGAEALPSEILFAMHEDFEASDLPFRVDVVDWNVTSDSFRKIMQTQWEILQEASLRKE